ncbi:MAG TPA: hypothetical protein V6C90_06310 [Coleofasciculaceae cyanobacterium]
MTYFLWERSRIDFRTPNYCDLYLVWRYSQSPEVEPLRQCQHFDDLR